MIDVPKKFMEKGKVILEVSIALRDRPGVPQVLFIFCSRKRGRWFSLKKNRKLMIKAKENNFNY